MKTYDKSSIFANFLAKHNKEVRWRCIARQWGSTDNPTIISRMKKAAQYVTDINLLKQIQSDLNFIKEINERNEQQKTANSMAVHQLQNIIANL